jgi:hypothetical protein
MHTNTPGKVAAVAALTAVLVASTLPATSAYLAELPGALAAQQEAVSLDADGPAAGVLHGTPMAIAGASPALRSSHSARFGVPAHHHRLAFYLQQSPGAMVTICYVAWNLCTTWQAVHGRWHGVVVAVPAKLSGDTACTADCPPETAMYELTVHLPPRPAAATVDTADQTGVAEGASGRSGRDGWYMALGAEAISVGAVQVL